MNYYVIFIKM